MIICFKYRYKLFVVVVFVPILLERSLSVDLALVLEYQLNILQGNFCLALLCLLWFAGVVVVAVE